MITCWMSKKMKKSTFYLLKTLHPKKKKKNDLTRGERTFVIFVFAANESASLTNASQFEYQIVLRRIQ